MNRSELRAFLDKLQTRPKKALSQNFLIEEEISDKILELAQVQPTDTILEIGPGPGALTKKLLKTGASVIAIEMDPIFSQELSRLQHPNLTVYSADILSFQLELLPEPLKIVANLPYHITTPILEKLFKRPFSSITIMVQKELGERILAKRGTNFSPLSLFVQVSAKTGPHFLVPKEAFYPAPKVDSMVLRLDAKPPPQCDLQKLFALARCAFQKRRKMLSTSLPKEKTRAALSDLNIPLTARPQDLDLEQWIALSEKIHY